MGRHRTGVPQAERRSRSRRAAPELLATILSMRRTVHTALKDLLAKDEAQRRYWTFYEAINIDATGQLKYDNLQELLSHSVLCFFENATILSFLFFRLIFQDPMRKELIGILLFFLVVFTLFSLFSFDPKDFFFHHSGVNTQIHNFFGYAGATVSGHLISLFGLGSYWIPIFLLISSIHFFNARPGTTIAVTITGGLILAITTGGLVSFRDHYIMIWGNSFSSGGQIGLYFHRFLIAYTNISGSLVILFLLWIIGLILTTGFSLVGFAKRFWMATLFVFSRKPVETKQESPPKDPPKKDSVKKRSKPSRVKPVDQPTLPISQPQPVFEMVQEELPLQVESSKNPNGFKLPSISFLDDPETRASSLTRNTFSPSPGFLKRRLRISGSRARSPPSRQVR